MKSPIIQLSLALLFLLLAATGYLFWYHAVGAVSARERALSQSIAAAAAENARAQAGRAEEGSLDADDAAVGQYFLADADVVPFLEALQALGSEAGATVSVVSVGADPGGSQTLAVSLHITGSFNAVARAVGAIEYAPYDLAETSLAIGQDAKESWHADLTLSVGSRGAVAASSAPSAPAALPAAPSGSTAPATAPL